MKTIKEIADSLGIDKQRVYRYIRKYHINEAHQENDTMYYNEMAEVAIIKYFSNDTVSHEVDQKHIKNSQFDTVISVLQGELEVKNRQIMEQQQTIRELTSALENTTASLHAAQALHAGTMQKQLTVAGADQVDQDPSANFFSRLFKRGKRP